MRTGPPPTELIHAIFAVVKDQDDDIASFSLACCLAGYLDNLPPEFRAYVLAMLNGEEPWPAEPLRRSSRRYQRPRRR